MVQLPTDRDNIDERSIFVKQVDYGVTPQELMEYFSTCGSITRIKILTTKQGVPKGLIWIDILMNRAAYIEFADPESVKSALMFSGNSFHDRTLVVEPKRKNIPRHFCIGEEAVVVVDIIDALIVLTNSLCLFDMFLV